MYQLAISIGWFAVLLGGVIIGWTSRAMFTREQDNLPKTSTFNNEYETFLHHVSCVNCGKRHYDENGIRTNGWITENQCFGCWTKHGSTQSQGLPSAREQAEQMGFNI